MFQTKWLAIGCMSLVLAGINGLSVSADILLNGGFENGTGGDADDWAEFSGPSGGVLRSSDMPRTGSFAAHMFFDHIANPAAGAAYFIEQNLGANSIDSTQNLDLTFWAKSESTDFTGANMFYQILWLDQDGSDGGGVQGEILTSLIGLGLNTTYQQFSLLDIDVPDAADSFLLRFQVAAGAVDGIANGLYVDDARLAVTGAVIPEPTSAGLIALTGIGMAIYRRRRN